MRYEPGDVIAKRFNHSWLAFRRQVVAARPTGYSWAYAFAPFLTFHSEGTSDPFFVYWELVERSSAMDRRHSSVRTA